MTKPTETLYAGATGPVGNTGCTPTPSPGWHRGQGAGLFQFTSTANNPPSWDRKMAGDFETLLPTTVSANVWTIVMNGSAIYIGTDVGVLRTQTAREAGTWCRAPLRAD